MLTKLENLLINLEDSIINLIKDKLDRKQIRTFTIDETLLLMNVNLSINKEVITNYNEHFPIHCKDIDMVNLIVKYIETCSKIVSYHHKDDSLRFSQPDTFMIRGSLYLIHIQYQNHKIDFFEIN